MPPATYGYAQIADRVDQVLGVRPAISTLRTAKVAQRRTAGLRARHDRITAGMPEPLTTSQPGESARFDAAQIEHWLANHPRVLKQQAEDAAIRALGRGDPELQVVRQARIAGLPWSRISRILTNFDGKTRTAQGLSALYRRGSVT